MTATAQLRTTQRTQLPPANAHEVPTRVRHRREDALLVAGWLLIAIPIAMYFGTYGFSAVSSLRSALEGVGILAGLIGTAQILLMLLLAARIPPLERTFGQDKVILLHSKLGKPAFYFIVGHVLLLTLAYAVSANVNPLTETGRLFASTGDMVQAYVALALLIVLVGSSLVLVRKKIPYEAWHIVHLISYAAVLTALPHQLSMSGIFTAGAWQTVYWMLFYWGTLGALLIFRVLAPSLTTLRFAPRVSGGRWLSSDVYAMTISGRDLHRLQIAGGQFMVFRFLTLRTALQAHPFSLSGTPRNNTMRITFKTTGLGAKRLAALPAGTRIFMEGPYGAFTHAAKTKRDSLYLGAGIGITPILALLANAPAQVPGAKQTVVFRTPRAGGVYHFDEFSRIATEHGVQLHEVAGHRAVTGDSWLASEHVARGASIRDYLREPLNTDVFICGEPSWANLVMADAMAAGVPRASIHHERFTT